MQQHAVTNRQEHIMTENPPFPGVMRSVAQVISYLLHPLFIPLLVTLLTVSALPEYFVTLKKISKRFPYDMLYFRVAIISIFFPFLTVLLARLLGFISSIYLKTQRDRIIPYVAIIIYYFWAFYTFLREGAAPMFYTSFFLGVFVAIVISFVTNNFVKTSMHTVGWGGVIGFLLTLMWGMNMNVSMPLIITFIVSGVVATARLVLAAHTPAEVYLGFLIGILSQLAAGAILL